MELLRLFPTTIGIFKNINTACHRQLYDRLNQLAVLETARIKSQLLEQNIKDRTIDNFFQSRSGLHLNSMFDNITNFVQQSALNYALECGFDIDPTKLYIADSWFNHSTGYIATHTPHTHSNSFLSAVYYLSAPEGSGSLYFLHPNMQVNSIDPDHKTQTVDNSTEFVIEPEEGMCVIFKSSTTHGVSSNSLDSKNRISIAYNFNVSNLGEKSISSHYNGVKR
jgi:uncharacterized protein (TIGR02466 family)